MSNLLCFSKSESTYFWFHFSCFLTQQSLRDPSVDPNLYRFLVYRRILLKSREKFKYGVDMQVLENHLISYACIRCFAVRIVQTLPIQNGSCVWYLITHCLYDNKPRSRKRFGTSQRSKVELHGDRIWH